MSPIIVPPGLGSWIPPTTYTDGVSTWGAADVLALGESLAGYADGGLANIDRNGHTGLYGPTSRGWWYPVAAVATATVHHYYRIMPTENMTVVSIGHVVANGAMNDDSVDMGLYDAAMNKIISTGLTAGKCMTIGTQSISISPTTLLARTVYYAAHKYGPIGGTAATLMQAHYGDAAGGRALGGTAGIIDASDMTATAAAALPATLVIPAITASAAHTMLVLNEA